MLAITKAESIFITCALTLLLSFPVLVNAQHDSYMGNETNLFQNELLSKAELADFSTSISAKIFKDEKNTYFAVNASKLSSQYEKIRFLELSFTNNIIVSIGYEEDMKYYYFLVNNSLHKSTEEVNDIFNGFTAQANTELQTMNEEQIRLWLLQHNKFHTK